ncbi:MAG TPA: sigma-70 family RNA polymerase sigma factor [Armatimonadota bacterium]|nr:sigma-70 family RNA polymerase sigma factor [Armatimonadota bacterium]
MYDEDALIDACQSGDVSAFEVLVRKYQDRTVRVLYLLLGNFDDAQDVAQEAFIRAFKCIRTFKGTSSFATCLHRIALNTAHNWIRDCKRQREVLVPFDDRWHTTCGNPEDELISREKVLQVKFALAQLPTYYREAIILRHYDDLSYEEIAEIQQVPVGTVRSRLAKARLLLQQHLSHAGDLNLKERVADNGMQTGKTIDPFCSRRSSR